MNEVLLLAGVIAFLTLISGVYIEWQDRREAARMRDALSRSPIEVWHDSTSGDPVDVEYREDK